MKRNLYIGSMLFLFSLLMVADGAPKITIVAPANADSQIIGTKVMIRWTHSAYYDQSAATCRIFGGETIISPPVPVRGDSFEWTVGKKADGGFMEPGNYEITIESNDYDALNGPTIPISYSEPKITIVAPADGQRLAMGTKVMIRWTHSAYYDQSAATCRIFGGEDFISPPVQVKADVFEWTAGKKEDGTFLAPGEYPITIESTDYDALSGPHVKLGLPVIHGAFIRDGLQLHIIPACPGCFHFDPSQISIQMEGLDADRIEIARGSRVFASVRIVKGRLETAPVRLVLDQDSKPLLNGQQPEFELRVLSVRSILLYKQAIRLVTAAK